MFLHNRPEDIESIEVLILPIPLSVIGALVAVGIEAAAGLVLFLVAMVARG
jgi:hypothetical protein